jgi:hypothetical protein
VDDTGKPTQDGQTDVDQEVGTTSALQEDTQRRQDDGENDLADVTVKSSQPWCSLECDRNRKLARASRVVLLFFQFQRKRRREDNLRSSKRHDVGGTELTGESRAKWERVGRRMRRACF